MCLGSGPSLAVEDIAFCRAKGFKLLAVNDAYRLCAGQYDGLYAAEQKWWGWNEPLGDIRQGALRFSLDPRTITSPPKFMQHVHLLSQTGMDGVEEDPRAIRHGGHSGYGAVNIAKHLGAKRIVLLGYDMMTNARGLHHFFGDHPDGTHLLYEMRRKLYPALCDELKTHGVELVNASRTSMIPVVPRVELVAL